MIGKSDGRRPIPAIGWAAGVDRLALLLEQNDNEIQSEKSQSLTIGVTCHILKEEMEEHGA